MSQERFIKRGEFAELIDELRTIEKKAAIHVQTIRNTVDRSENIYHMDLETAAIAVRELQTLQLRYRAIWPRAEELRKDLGL